MARHTDSNLTPDTFSHFDQLPDCAFVRQPIVERLFACSAATVWRYVASCRIPKPRKLSHRVTVWNVGQLRAVLASVLAEQMAQDSQKAHG